MDKEKDDDRIIIEKSGDIKFSGILGLDNSLAVLNSINSLSKQIMNHVGDHIHEITTMAIVETFKYAKETKKPELEPEDIEKILMPVLKFIQTGDVK